MVGKAAEHQVGPLGSAMAAPEQETLAARIEVVAHSPLDWLSSGMRMGNGTMRCRHTSIEIETPNWTVSDGASSDSLSPLCARHVPAGGRQACWSADREAGRAQRGRPAL